MKLEEFEDGIDKVLKDLKRGPLEYSCDLIGYDINANARSYYNKILRPNSDIYWLYVESNWNESDEFYQDMRVTVILLFEQYCISEQLYLEF